ncbi:tRNA1(Val) (adenine(37)-N6)-methyltransferase [Mycoplasmopsis pulmonis]|nr:tRNA1(Val) (adenine(37)-N6)-methyltransferase [Mycoplasmopsis pulmonis]MDZ7293519.1 tRNA1(Val) (adenine(37)-N6)-methyltransferase [Mycoplasmopsis pulmonis]
MMNKKKQNLVLNNLGFDSNLKVYQDKDAFNYSVDTILLGNFIHLTTSIKYALEIGANNGALSIFVASRKKDLKIDAVEIQKEPSELAQKNVELNNLESQIKIINQDFNDFYKNHQKNTLKKYQSIFVNPPYYQLDKNKTKKIEKSKLIATHEVSINLEQIIKGSRGIIEQKGYLNFVIPIERLVDLFYLLRKYNFEPKRVQLVYPRIYEKAKFALVESRFNSGWGVHFLKNLYLHPEDKNDHSYLEEIKKKYKPKIFE